MSSRRPVSRKRENHDMLPSNHGTHVPGSQANAPIEGLASLKSNPSEVLKLLYKLRATAIKTPFKDCHHEDAFYTKLMEYVKTSRYLEWRRLLEHFNLSFRTSREKILEDQLIKFEMPSEHLKN